MKTVNCSRKTLYSAIKKFYTIFLVTDHLIAQITDLVIMNLTEGDNLSHTDRYWILMAIMLGSDWQFSTVHGDPWYILLQTHSLFGFQLNVYILAFFCCIITSIPSPINNYEQKTEYRWPTAVQLNAV
jgi:predicted branched-subunit amino acid permease